MYRLWILAFAPLLFLLGTPNAAAAAPRPHGALIKVKAPNQSLNWSGYNQGALEKGKTFHEISATWQVPTATSAQKGQNQYSATWVGIGGGCVDASCLVGDATLIQAGTEQDVDSSGQASYFTWWELIPAPSVQAPVAVSPGDTVHVDIAEGAPEVWTITIQNLTTHQSWSQTQPYTSSYATAEWIEETPLVIDGSGNFLALLPRLSTVHFDHATADAAPAALVSSEEIQLVSSNGHPLATPSAPDPDADGFNDCTYASKCPAPKSS